MNDEATAGAEKETHHYLRGKFIATVVEVEQSIDAVLANFFGVQQDVKEEFRWWILNAVGMGDKVTAIRGIIRAMGAESRYPDLSRQLDALNTRRNELAHRPVHTVTFVNHEGGSYGGLMQNVRRPKDRSSDWRPEPLDVLAEEITAAEALLLPLTHLFVECKKRWLSPDASSETHV